MLSSGNSAFLLIQTGVIFLTILLGTVLLFLLWTSTPKPMVSYRNHLLNITFWSMACVLVILVAQPTTVTFSTGFCFQPNWLGALLPRLLVHILMILMIVLTLNVGVAICLSFAHRYFQIRSCLRVGGATEESTSSLALSGAVVHATVFIYTSVLIHFLFGHSKDNPDLSDLFCLNTESPFYTVFLVSLLIFDSLTTFSCIFLCVLSLRSLLEAKKAAPSSFAFQRMLTLGLVVSSALPVSLGAIPSAVGFLILKFDPFLVGGLARGCSLVASVTAPLIFALSLVMLKPYREKLWMLLRCGKNPNVRVSAVSKL
ncbi:hypothetical protein QR680_004818 [Steinernema hermaphroditum]|uniref:Uncharacterized protein n=1 Tax=Steinernema hermaphroditum TaxID=289476 RepID=A0AA39HPX4_9BILA|nr:hypothetical protein QR680_004818 [Steinernema hermaphroditum]